MLRKIISENRIIIGVLLGVIIIQTIMMSILISQRQYLFCDEVYSYGLANSVDRTFLSPQETAGKWIPSELYTSYTLYQDTEGFNFVAAYANQDADVHPPLYYMLIHVFSRLFQRDNLDVLPGVLLNIICMYIADILLLYISQFIFQEKKYVILPLIIWGLSSACISNCVFIRMYMMQTAEILLFMAYHIYVLRHWKKLNPEGMLVFSMIVAVGGLTHYYFYVFAGTFAFCVCIYLLIRKQYKDMFKYGISLLWGIVCALFVFPSTLSKHILGYRGAETIEAVSGLDIKTIIFRVCEALAEQMGHYIVFIVLGLLFFVTLVIRRSHDDIIFHKNSRLSFFAITLITSIAFSYFVMQGSQSANAIRYLYPIIAVYSLLIAYMIISISRAVESRKQGIVAIVVSVLLPILSLSIHGVDWMYKNFDRSQLEPVHNTDAIAFYDPEIWSDVYAAIVAMNEYDEIVFVPIQQYQNINYQDLATQRKTASEEISIISIASIYANHYADEKGALDKVAGDLGYTGEEYVAGVSIFDWKAYKLIK